jgi:hypothetical protein
MSSQSHSSMVGSMCGCHGLSRSTLVLTSSSFSLVSSTRLTPCCLFITKASHRYDVALTTQRRHEPSGCMGCREISGSCCGFRELTGSHTYITAHGPAFFCRGRMAQEVTWEAINLYHSNCFNRRRFELFREQGDKVWPLMILLVGS